MKNSILPMKLSHLPEVAALSDELGYPVQQDQLNERFSILQGLKNHHLLVFESDRGISGFIHLEAVDDLIEARKVEIKSLIVNKSERGNGIGQALIKASCEWAKMYGVHTIYLSCNTLRNATHVFYERAGFTKMKTSHFFEMNI